MLAGIGWNCFKPQTFHQYLISTFQGAENTLPKTNSLPLKIGLSQPTSVETKKTWLPSKLGWTAAFGRKSLHIHPCSNFHLCTMYGISIYIWTNYGKCRPADKYSSPMNHLGIILMQESLIDGKTFFESEVWRWHSKTFFAVSNESFFRLFDTKFPVPPTNPPLGGSPQLVSG